MDVADVRNMPVSVIGSLRVPGIVTDVPGCCSERRLSSVVVESCSGGSDVLKSTKRCILLRGWEESLYQGI